MTVVVGTAGHIDHGKTALLRALTGIDADRLPEERQRGMTIDVGYAHFRLPDGEEIDFVDVPGHDRLIGNMLVGAGEIDAALLVVAADDGPRAQTIEHLELLDALGIKDGLAVVTKVDLAGTDRTASVVALVHELLGRTSLAGLSVLTASAITGEGLDRVTTELVRLMGRLARAGTAGRRLSSGRHAPASAPVRLPIDRVFAIRGRGLVVTGSLRGGGIERGAVLRLVPGEETARARELQIHGAPVDRLEGGGRLAMNLAGPKLEQVRRGDVLTNDPEIRSTDHLIALVRPVARIDDHAPAAAWPLKSAATYRLHLGTASVDARLRRGRRESAALPDGRWAVTLGLASPVAVASGDRFVLRLPSPGTTAAGGIVIDPAPPVGASRRRVTPDALAGLAMAWESGDDIEVLGSRVNLHGLVPVPAAGRAADRVPGSRAIGGWLVDERIVSDLEQAAEGAVRLQHQAEPLVGGLSVAELRRDLGRQLRRKATSNDATAVAIAGSVIDGLVGAGQLGRRGDLVHDPGRGAHLPPNVLEAMDRLEQALAVQAPPPLADAARSAGCPAEGVRSLEASGRIVRVEDDLAWAAPTYRALEALAVRLAALEPLTPAALRDATGTSRKYVTALLEDLDRRDVLRRTPAGHVLGPHAPR